MMQLELYSKPYVLAVDDEALNRYLLEDIIENRYELTLVDSGQACLDSIEQRVPDLILLDINMPGMSGFEVCKTLQANSETKQIPIIFLTALLGVDDERLGLEIGAVDYITKPFTDSILLARMKTHLVLNSTRQLLEESHQVLRTERDYIEQIISSMRHDKRFYHEQLRMLVSPVENSNGDIVLSACVNEQHHMIVGDFTGHGLTAAIAGPLVSSLFYSHVTQSCSPMDIMELINSELFCKLPTQNFLAAIYLHWDKKQKQMTVWNFGMPDAVVINDSNHITLLPSTNLAMGVVELDKSNLTPHTLSFNEGDNLYIYTDGLQEAQNQMGEQFGLTRLHEALLDISTQQLALREVLNRITAFTQDEVLNDDATLVEVKG